MPGRTAEDGQNAWVPASYEGDLEEASVSWLQSGPSLTVVAIWRVTQWMEYLSPPLSLTVFQMKNQIFKKKRGLKCREK